MKHVTSYLHFNGNCREAIQFYNQCLGGELHLIPYPDERGQPATDPNAKIMHSQISRNGQPFLMASDSGPAGAVNSGSNFSVAVECDSIEEIEQLFAAVGEGGQVRMPPSDVPWGARFGMLTDRFGIQWFFNYTIVK